MLYYIEEIEQISNNLRKALLPYLSRARIEQMNRYRFQSDRVQSMLAFILLRVALLTEYNFCEMPLFEVRTSGKPYLKNKPEVFFNLSHCKKGVACAVSDCEVGVDIQDYVDYKESTALYFMSREEQLQAKAQNPRAEFTRLWTLKESYGKYTGMGICYNMASHAVTDGAFVGGCISESFLLNGFALSYTSEKRLSSVRIPLSELPANCRKLRKL